jgi:hypothetical protein
MAIPTLDQTEGIWMARTEEGEYYYILDVFPETLLRESLHLDNCNALVQRGSLIPEQPDLLRPTQRVWERTQRYCHQFS